MGRPVRLGKKATFIKSHYLVPVYCLLIEAREDESLRVLDDVDASLVHLFNDYLKKQTPFIGNGEMPLWPARLDSADGRRILRRLLEAVRMEVRSVGSHFPKERINDLHDRWSNRRTLGPASEDLPIESLEGPLDMLLELATDPPPELPPQQ